MPEEDFDPIDAQVKLAACLTEAVLIASRLLETRFRAVIYSSIVGADAATPLSETLRALLTARERFALTAQGALQDQKFRRIERAEGASDATR